jgi:hypothetical protein
MDQFVNCSCVQEIDELPFTTIHSNLPKEGKEVFRQKQTMVSERLGELS